MASKTPPKPKSADVSTAKSVGANKPKFQHSVGQPGHAKQLVDALKKR